MYWRSEKERLGCHGHSVKIKYRLRKVMTTYSTLEESLRVPLSGFPSGTPARPTHAPLYPEVLPDPCRPLGRVEGVRQATT